MATEEDSQENIPTSGAVFTFGRSRFSDNEPNRFWIRDDPVKQVACGDEHTVLLTFSGRVFTFGSNDYGQLGHGSNKPFNKPTSIKGLKGHQVYNVACGRSHTLILLTSGETLSCGQNNEGQLGVGDENIRQVPVEITKLNKVKISSIAGGAEHSVALTANGLLYVWGSNSDGQLGLDDINQTNLPHSIDFQEHIKQVACGYYHTAFITEKGLLYTFGEADYGKLGYVASRNVFVPKLVNTVRGKVKKVVCGGRHTVALTETGLIYAFGDGSQGQLGLGPETLEAHQPGIVEKLSKMKIKDLECGENHAAVITESKQLYVWGDGQYGKLGIGRNGANAFLPTLVDKFTKFDVLGVGCGGCHTLVLARPSNSWQDREYARRKLTTKAVSFHGRDAKSSNEDDDSDKNSDNEKRKYSTADFSTSAARNKRRLNSLHDSSSSINLNRTLPPLAQRNGVLPAYSERNFKQDPFARQSRQKSDDSDSDASSKPPAKSTPLYTSNTAKTDPFSRYSTDKRKSTDSDSDASPRTNNLKNKSQSFYKLQNQKKTSDSSDDDRSTKSEPSKYQNSSQKMFNNNGRKEQLPQFHKSGSFTTQFDYTKNNKSKMAKSDSDSDRDDKHQLPITAKRNLKVRKSSESSNDERSKNKKRNDSASTQSSYSRRDDKILKNVGKPKFLDKIRGSISKKKSGPGRDDSDTETTTSKEAVKSKTCVLL